MPALKGSLTYARFFVEGEPPKDFRERFMRAIRLLASLLVMLAPAAPALAQDVFAISVAPGPNACGGFRPVTAQEV